MIDPGDGPAGEADTAAVADVPIELLLEVMPPPDGTTGRCRSACARIRIACARCAAGACARWASWRRCRPTTWRRGWARPARTGGTWREARITSRWCPHFPKNGSSSRSIWSGRSKGLEPLSFVLGRLIEPLSAHLERRDRGVAVLHVRLRLVNKTVHEQSLQLPTPMRDPKALRTIALLALESNPPAAGIDRVTVTADPTPARVLQHSLLTRPVPMPEEIATLMARLNALMGEGRCGAPAVVDSWRPGACAVALFAPDTTTRAATPVISTPAGARAPPHLPRWPCGGSGSRFPRASPWSRGKPVRVATDRRGMTGGRVEMSAGPWRTSGQWWEDGKTSQAPSAVIPWDRDEWDVTLSDGATYRVFTERGTRAWFVDGLFD